MPQWIDCKVWMFSDIVCLKAICKHDLHHVDHVFLLLLFNHKYYSHQWLYCFDFAATICLQHRCWRHTSTPLSWLLPPSSLPSKTCFPYWLSSVWRHAYGLKTQMMLWQVVPSLHKFLDASWESNTVISILIPPFLISYTASGCTFFNSIFCFYYAFTHNLLQQYQETAVWQSHFPELCKQLLEMLLRSHVIYWSAPPVLNTDQPIYQHLKWSVSKITNAQWVLSEKNCIS